MKVARRRTWGSAAVTALALAVLPAPSAQATSGSGGRLAFPAHLDRIVDTRYGVGVPFVGATVGPLVLLSGAALTVSVTDVTAAGQVFVHPCGSAPAPSPAIFLLRAGETMTNTVVTPAAPTCLSSTTPVEVIVDHHADVAATPFVGGLQYVPLPTPLDASIPFAFSGDAQIDLPTVPADAAGTVLGITAAAVDGPGYVTVFRCDQPRPIVSDVLAGATPSGSVVITALATAGASTQCVFASARTVLQVTVLGYLAATGPDTSSVPPTLRWNYEQVAPPGLEPLTPTRVLDTRSAIGTVTADKLAAGREQVLDLAPFVTFQTTAVVLNVTATEPDAAGYLTVYPCDQDRPTASNLNYVRGQTVPNLVTVALAADATVCIYSQARTHLVADLTATYEFGAGDGVVAVAPDRLLDTREPIGAAAAGKVEGGHVLTLQVAGRGGVPTSGATAVTMNVTATAPEADGYATVYPCDARKRPTASNLNYVTGQTVPNAVTVKLSATGTVCIYTQSTTHLVADLNAWFGPAAGDGFEELVPQRVLDTRTAWAPGVQLLSGAGRLVANQDAGIAVTGYSMVPASARSVVLNVTVTNPRGSGFLAVYPCGSPRPVVSNLNFEMRQTVANQVTVGLGNTVGGSQVCFGSQQNVDVVVDVAGYYTDVPEQGWVPDVAALPDIA